MGMDEFTGAPALNADLAVTKTDTPDPVVEGSDIVYTVTVTNNGPGDATTVTLVDSLDALVSFVSATPSQGTCNENAGTVTCDLLNVGNGATVTTTITVATPDVAEPTMVSNTANVSAPTPDVITLYAKAGAFAWQSDLDVLVISGGTGRLSSSGNVMS